MAESVCIIGKVQHARSAMCQLVEVAVDNTVCDLVVETSLPEIGKVGWQYLVIPSDDALSRRLQTDNNVVFKTRATGHNHTLHMVRNFILTNVEVTLVPNGAR